MERFQPRKLEGSNLYVAGGGEDYDPRKHKYYELAMCFFKAIQDCGKETPLIKSPFESHFNIHHDDWCAVYKGGYCNCSPKIDVDVRMSDGGWGKFEKDEEGAIGLRRIDQPSYLQN